MKNLNQIIAAIILTFVVVLGIIKSSDYIYRVEAPKAKLKVEAKAINQTSDQKTNIEETDIKAFLAMGNVELGAKIFNQCKACHSIKENGKNKIGPKLYSVLGRPMASISDFKYSKALASIGEEWNFQTMNKFLIKPSAYIKGTKMAYKGLSKEADRASVILYLTLIAVTLFHYLNLPKV